MARNKSYKDGYSTICLECMKDYSRNRRNDIEFIYKSKAKKFNTSIEHVKELFNKNKTCQICGCVDTRRSLSIDHDHVTGKVRGLLCDACNTGLGKFKDNQEILLAAIEYLKKYS